MKITLTTFLLTLIVLGVGQAQTPKIEQHGWKLVQVGYKDEPFTEKSDKEYGQPSAAFFVKDYPYKVGQEFPKLLQIHLLEARTIDSHDVGKQISMTLSEFDCRRGLIRDLKTFWTDGSETSARGLELIGWTDVLEGAPAEAFLKYACRPRTPSKK
jgi:hypothetical protein